MWIRIHETEKIKKIYALAKDYPTPNRTGILFQDVLKRLDSPFLVEKIGRTTDNTTTFKKYYQEVPYLLKFLLSYRTMETSDAGSDLGSGIWDSVLFLTPGSRIRIRVGKKSRFRIQIRDGKKSGIRYARSGAFLIPGSEIRYPVQNKHPGSATQLKSMTVTGSEIFTLIWTLQYLFIRVSSQQLYYHTVFAA
jgi:hypothetical protein